MASNADPLPEVGTRTCAHHIAEVVEETVVIPKKPQKPKKTQDAAEGEEPDNGPNIDYKTTRMIRIDGQVMPLEGVLRFITLDWCGNCLNSLACDPTKRCTHTKGVGRTKCNDCSSSHKGTASPCNLPVVELRSIGSNMVIEALKLGDIKFEMLKLKSSTVPGDQKVQELRTLEQKHKKTQELYKIASNQWKKGKADLNKKVKESAKQSKTANKGKGVEGKNIQAKNDGAGAQTEGAQSEKPPASDKFAVYLHPKHAAAPFVQRIGPQGVLTTSEKLSLALGNVCHALSQFNDLVQTRPELDSSELRKLQLEQQRVSEYMKQYTALAGQMVPAPNAQLRPDSMGQSSSNSMGQTSSAPNGQVYAASMGQSACATMGQGPSAPHGQTRRASKGQSSSSRKGQSSSAPQRMSPSTRKNKKYSARINQSFSAPNGQVDPTSTAQSSFNNMNQTSFAPSGQVDPTSIAQSSFNSMDQMFSAPNGQVDPASIAQSSFNSMDQMFSAPNGQVHPASMGQSSSASIAQGSASDVQMGGALAEQMPNNGEAGLDLDMVDVDFGQLSLPEFMYQQHDDGNGQWPVIGAGFQQFELNMGQQAVLEADSEQLGLAMNQQAGPNMLQQADPNLGLFSFSDVDYMQPDADMGDFFN